MCLFIVLCAVFIHWDWITTSDVFMFLYQVIPSYLHIICQCVEVMCFEKRRKSFLKEVFTQCWWIWIVMFYTGTNVLETLTVWSIPRWQMITGRFRCLIWCKSFIFSYMEQWYLKRNYPPVWLIAAVIFISLIIYYGQSGESGNKFTYQLMKTLSRCTLFSPVKVYFFYRSGNDK